MRTRKYSFLVFHSNSFKFLQLYWFTKSSCSSYLISISTNWRPENSSSRNRIQDKLPVRANTCSTASPDLWCATLPNSAASFSAKYCSITEANFCAFPSCAAVSKSFEDFAAIFFFTCYDVTFNSFVSFSVHWELFALKEPELTNSSALNGFVVLSKECHIVYFWKTETNLYGILWEPAGILK